MKNKRSFYMALILLLGVALTIGYAVLSQTLKIKGNTSIASNSWIIYFDHLVERPGTLEATSPAKINAAKDRIDFTITLNEPGDNYTYETDIVNDGTIDAMIDSVSLSGLPASLNGIVEWKVNYLDGTELRRCDELLAKTKRRIRVVVNYKKDIDELPAATDMELSLEVHYVQLDNTECSTTNPSTPDPIDPEDGRHTLTVDPNYGIYKGTDAPEIVRMAPGEVYVFSADPIRAYHFFTGWRADVENYIAESNIITMGDEDLLAIADWTREKDEENYTDICFATNGLTFSDFEAAVANIAEEGTITLVANDCQIGDRGRDSYIKIDGKNIIFDLNGLTIDAYTTINTENGTNFTITDTSDRKSGTFNAKYNSHYSQVIYNYGANVNIDGGTYNVQGELINNSSGHASINNAIIVMNNETSERDLYALHNFGEAEILNTTINVDTYKSGSEIIYAYSSNEISMIKDVTINIKGHNAGMVYAIRGGGLPHIENVSIDIEGAFNNTLWGIYGGGSTSILKNITIKANNTTSGNTYGIFAPGISAEAESLDVDIKATSGRVYGIYLSSINYEGGNIKIEADSGEVYGIYNTNNNTLNNINLDVRVLSQGKATGGNLGNVEINNSNFYVETTFMPDSSFTTYTIDGSNVTINNSKIESISHGPKHYNYGIGASTVTAKNLDLTAKSDYYTYGIYSYDSASVEDSVLNIYSKEYAFGIVNALTIDNTTINVESTRNSGVIPSDYSVSVCGVKIKDDTTINESTINVNSNPSANSSNVNNTCTGF